MIDKQPDKSIARDKEIEQFNASTPSTEKFHLPRIHNSFFHRKP
jgi:hypothetical protein